MTSRRQFLVAGALGALGIRYAVAQADEFEFVINANAARAPGVRIPESVMARATKIVQ